MKTVVVMIEETYLFQNMLVVWWEYRPSPS